MHDLAQIVVTEQSAAKKDCVTYAQYRFMRPVFEPDFTSYRDRAYTALRLIENVAAKQKTPIPTSRDLLRAAHELVKYYEEHKESI